MSIDDLPQDIGETVSTILVDSSMRSLQNSVDPFTVQRLGGDGSNRRFWRLEFADNSSVMVIAPERQETKWLREAEAGYRIGSHLQSCGAAVPDIYGYDGASGILLCEDLGSVHLHDIAVATDWSNDESVGMLRMLYRETLTELSGMQCQGKVKFDRQWCWDTPAYDRQLMLDRESGYFLRAFWQGLLGQEIPAGLSDEFVALADAAAEAPAGYFLHRDFQSRNIMIKEGRVRVIDYQGGRLGPPAYDLASLLLDPYADLPQWFQQELYEYYLRQLDRHVSVSAHEFLRWYQLLALQRNLQILGAFAHLSTVCGKRFFHQYIPPALTSLVRLASECVDPRLPILVQVAHKARKLLR